MRILLDCDGVICNFVDKGKVLEMKPFEGSKEFVKKLKSFGELAVATAPFKSPNWIPERLKWLEINFGFKADDVCVWSKKHWIQADILIDDAIENVLKFPGKVCLLDSPWNQCKTLPSNVTRCFDYDDILNCVDLVYSKMIF